MTDTEPPPAPAPPASPEAGAGGEPSGIGGWLILPGIHLILSPGLAAFAIAREFVGAGANSDASLADYWRGVQLLNGNQRLAAVFLGIIVFWIGYAVFSLVQFFHKKRQVPEMMAGFYILSAAVAVGNYALLTKYPAMPVTPDMLSDATLWILRAVVAAAIWIPYFYLSDRVKNTFVN